MLVLEDVDNKHLFTICFNLAPKYMMWRDIFTSKIISLVLYICASYFKDSQLISGLFPGCKYLEYSDGTR